MLITLDHDFDPESYGHADTETVARHLAEQLTDDFSDYTVLELDDAVNEIFLRLRGAICNEAFFMAIVGEWRFEEATKHHLLEKLLSAQVDYDDERQFLTVEVEGVHYVAVPNDYLLKPTW